MHQLIMNISRDILSKTFNFKKKLIVFYIYEIYTLFIGFNVKLMRSYLFILKVKFKKW